MDDDTTDECDRGSYAGGYNKISWWLVVYVEVLALAAAMTLGSSNPSPHMPPFRLLHQFRPFMYCSLKCQAFSWELVAAVLRMSQLPSPGIKT